MNNLDKRSHCTYFMGYAANTVVFLYWKPDQPYYIHRFYHAWFDKYNYRLSTEENHTPGSLLIQQDTESLIHDSDLLNLITCEIYLTSNKCFDATMTTYDIDTPPDGSIICFDLLDDE